MTPKVGIFYLSYENGPSRHEIKLSSGKSVFIRVEETDAGNPELALDKADPLPDEWVMNTHDLPNENE